MAPSRNGKPGATRRRKPPVSIETAGLPNEGQVVRLTPCLAILCALVFAAPPAVPEAGAAPAARGGAVSPRPAPALFGTREIYSPDIAAFTKWTGMLARF